MPLNTKHMTLPEATAALELTGQQLTPEKVKAQFRKLAMKHHPDRGGDAKKFQQVTDAYELLKDVKPDGTFASANSSAWASMFNRNQGPTTARASTTSGVTMEDILENFRRAWPQVDEYVEAQKRRQRQEATSEVQKVENKGMERAIAVLRAIRSNKETWWNAKGLGPMVGSNNENKILNHLDTLIDFMIIDIQNNKHGVQ